MEESTCSGSLAEAPDVNARQVQNDPLVLPPVEPTLQVTAPERPVELSGATAEPQPGTSAQAVQHPQRGLIGFEPQAGSSDRERPTCRVCFVRKRNTLLNCGHTHTCSVCVQQVSNCPICRAPISKIYWPLFL